MLLAAAAGIVVICSCYCYQLLRSLLAAALLVHSCDDCQLAGKRQFTWGCDFPAAEKLVFFILGSSNSVWHRVSTAREEKGRGRRLFCQTEPN